MERGHGAHAPAAVQQLHQRHAACGECQPGPMVLLFIELGKLDQLTWVLQWLSPGHVDSFSQVELHSFELLSGAPSPPFLAGARTCGWAVGTHISRCE